MKHDIHQPSDFFEYVRVNGAVPPPSRDRVDAVILDMNHAWPNLGHDSIVHAVMDVAEEQRETLVTAGAKVRALSFDVRRGLKVPEHGRFELFVGTGGPGQLDPRLNNGISETSQGTNEDPSWEAPLFRLYDDIMAREAALIGICHSFGLMCRWSGAARVELRPEKSAGMPFNALSESAAAHPWFAEFARQLPDRRHFRVVDNRLFDLIVEQPRGPQHIAFEDDDSDALTILELARDAEGMPRVMGVNHHPEIVDRAHALTVLEEKRAHHEVTERWVRERAETMTEMFVGDAERQSRLTSEYTLIGPLRHHVNRLVEERCGALATLAEPLTR
jgi:anthranilate/para-aminobenzoate synthase component II